MSASFIEITHPCKECLVRAACSDFKNKGEFRLRMDEFHSNVLCLRSNTFKEHNQLEHKKDLIEAWINFGHKLLYNIESDKLPKQTIFIKKMLDTLQYLINSKSWRDNSKIQPFDYDEILKCLVTCKCKLE